MALDLRSLTSKDGPRTPQEAADPTSPRKATPADPQVGWNAGPTPPPDSVTEDEQTALTNRVLHRIAGPIDQLAGSLEVIAEYMRQQRDREQKRFFGVTLSTISTPFRNAGRPYNALIAQTTPGKTLSIQWPGEAPYTKAMVGGWNILNVPDGTNISIDSGTLDCIWVTAYEFLGAPL